MESRCKNYLYNPCTAYCALSASDNSRVGSATLLYVTYCYCPTNQYKHYKKNTEPLLMQEPASLHSRPHRPAVLERIADSKIETVSLAETGNIEISSL